MSTQVRERVARAEVRRTSLKLPLGLNPGEAVAALIGIALLLWVAVFYFSSLKPERDRLQVLETQLTKQQQDIIQNMKPDSATERSPAEEAKDALDSLESFKSGHLKQFSSGRIELIKQINALAKKNGASLTSGIDMGSTTNEANADAGATAAKKGNAVRKKSDEISAAFPSVNFRFTVFGQYSNLRSFINELEREKQFLVINAVNLTNQEAKTSGRRARSEGSSGIMLTIEMSAYFQPM